MFNGTGSRARFCRNTWILESTHKAKFFILYEIFLFPLLLYCYLCYKHSPLYLHCQLDNVTSSLEAQYAQYAIWLFWRPICHYTKVVNTLRWCIIPGGSLRGKWNWNVWYLTEILLDPPLGPLMQRLHPQMTSPFDISIFSKGNCSLKPFPPLQPPVLKSSSQTQNLLLTQTVRKRHPQTYHNDHIRTDKDDRQNRQDKQDRQGTQEQHWNLTLQDTCVGQLLQFLRYYKTFFPNPSSGSGLGNLTIRSGVPTF